MASASQNARPAGPPAETIRADVLIIGAGLAGLYVAQQLAPQRRVLVIAPDGPGRGGSSGWAQGGIAAALGDDDSADRHVADTIAAGAGLVDDAIARILAEDGPARVRHLSELLQTYTDSDFDRDATDAFHLSLEAAHSRARVARVTGDQAGKVVTRAVARAAQAREGVTLQAGLRACALQADPKGRIAGVLAEDKAGRRVVITARDSVLAMGGIGGLYAVTTNPVGAQGDGLALAALAGARLADLEFVQFHPTALDVGRDPAPLATEALRGEGAVLLDAEGRALVDPLGPRDAVARAVHTAKQEGRGAFLDARDAIGAAFPERFPTVFAACQAAGLDPRTDRMPVAPAAHYHMGGVVTDAWGRTDVAGLWAVGETARTGAHGANRLASNSLLEAVVFARRAAQALAEGPASDGGAPDLSAVAPPPPLPAPALMTLRTAMAREAGVVRDAAGLTRLLEVIDALEAQHGRALALISARCVAVAALHRRESRGAHWRADYPQAVAQGVSSGLTWDGVRGQSAAAVDVVSVEVRHG